MTRFFITLNDAIFNVTIFYIKDLIKLLNPNIKIKIIGTRPGEKIHEIFG